MRRIGIYGGFVALAFLMVGASLTVEAQTEEFVEIGRGEVVKVVGNNVLVRVEGEGVKRYVIPFDYPINHEGEQITVVELREGMIISGRINTTAAPEDVDEQDLVSIVAGLVEDTKEAMGGDEAAAESTEAPTAEAEAPAAVAAAEESATTAEAATTGSESGGMSPLLMLVLAAVALFIIVMAFRKFRQA
jgi:hypothetical protein